MTQLLITLSAEERAAIVADLSASLLPQIAALLNANALVNNVVNNATADTNAKAEELEQAADDAKAKKTVSRKATSKKQAAKEELTDDSDEGGEETEVQETPKKTSKKAPPAKNKKTVDLGPLKEDAADWLEWIEGDDEIIPQVEAIFEELGVTAEPDVSDEDYPDFHAKFREIIAANFQLPE